MKKKGFTLVELLGVITVLAILFLITTPIVIKIIENANIEGEKKSILGYARTIENDISSYVMMNNSRNYSDYIIPNDLDYKGNTVICESENVSDDGKVTLLNCYATPKKRNQITDTLEEGKNRNRYDYINGQVTKSGHGSEDDNPSITKTAVQELLSKTNDISVTTYEQGSEASHQMYTFSHPATFQTNALTDYRYIGLDPYNYVEFNDEIWRIIGIFTVEDETGKMEKRLKIVPNQSLNQVMNWDFNEQNDWTKSTLNQYLNTEYYNDLNYSDRLMIDNIKYYLGEISEQNIEISVPDIYMIERGNQIQNGHSISWIGKIGLAYPSDLGYTYANDVYIDGFNNIHDIYFTSCSWIEQILINKWSINSVFDSTDRVMAMTYSSYVLDGLGVSPVLYLKSSVKLKGGTGTSSDPYKLKI